MATHPIRCPRCKYDLSSLGEACVCPECGTDEEARTELWAARVRARSRWLLAYWFVTTISAAPLILILINITAALVYLDARPGSWAWHAQSGQFAVLDITATLSILGLLGTLVLWPVLVVMFGCLVYADKSASRNKRLSPVVWLLMVVAHFLPVYQLALGTQMVFPDS